LSVNSLASKLTARVQPKGRVKVRDRVRVEVTVRVRVRVSVSVSLNKNNSGAGELTDKYPPVSTLCLLFHTANLFTKSFPMCLLVIFLLHLCYFLSFYFHLKHFSFFYFMSRMETGELLR